MVNFYECSRRRFRAHSVIRGLCYVLYGKTSFKFFDLEHLLSYPRVNVNQYEAFGCPPLVCCFLALGTFREKLRWQGGEIDC